MSFLQNLQKSLKNIKWFRRYSQEKTHPMLKIYGSRLNSRSLLAIIDKYGGLLRQWAWLYEALLEVSMNKISLWINVCVDDWTAEMAITALKIQPHGNERNAWRNSHYAMCTMHPVYSALSKMKVPNSLLPCPQILTVHRAHPLHPTFMCILN